MNAHRRYLAAATAGVAITTLAVTAPGAVAATPSACAKAPAAKTVAYKRVSGVPANLTSLDVYAPSRACRRGRSAPVVMWVHGGGYSVGDKANQIRDKVKLFTGRGYVLVSVNYRLSVPGRAKSAKYPDHFRDVAAAVSWVQRNIGRSGGDRKRVAAAGTLGRRGHRFQCDRRSPLAQRAQAQPQGRALCRRAGHRGLRQAGGRPARAGAVAAGVPEPAHLCARYLGGEPDPPGRRHPADDHGRARNARRQAIVQRYAATLRRAGVSATVVDARSLSHEQVNRRIGAPGDKVMTPPLTRFLGRCFAR